MVSSFSYPLGGKKKVWHMGYLRCHLGATTLSPSLLGGRYTRIFLTETRLENI